MTGIANCGNAVRHLTIELYRSDEGDAVGSPAPSETASTESAPQTAKPAAGPTTPTAPKVEPAKMQPYKEGGGHHVPAKKAFEGPSGYTAGYDPQKAPAIPKAELKKMGIEHQQITVAQQKAYIDFAKTGQPLTCEAIAKIETDALIKNTMPSDVAHATVTKAIEALKANGVAAPVRVPWGK